MNRLTIPSKTNPTSTEVCYRKSDAEIYRPLVFGGNSISVVEKAPVDLLNKYEICDPTVEAVFDAELSDFMRTPNLTLEKPLPYTRNLSEREVLDSLAHSLWEMECSHRHIPRFPKAHLEDFLSDCQFKEGRVVLPDYMLATLCVVQDPSLYKFFDKVFGKLSLEEEWEMKHVPLSQFFFSYCNSDDQDPYDGLIARLAVQPFYKAYFADGGKYQTQVMRIFAAMDSEKNLSTEQVAILIPYEEKFLYDNAFELLGYQRETQMEIGKMELLCLYRGMKK